MPEPESENVGVACPKCGCRHLKAAGGTHRIKRFTIRYRICRHCGYKVRTKEFIDHIYEESDSSEK